jgi:DNA-binding Lrp family transcriptional regulator
MEMEQNQKLWRHKMKTGEIFNPHGLFNGIHIPDCICSLDSISWSAKACWGKLKEYAGTKGVCFPKQDNIAKDLGLSISTVKRALKELEDEQFIKINKPVGFQKLMHYNCTYSFLWKSCMSESCRIVQNGPSEGSQNEPPNIKESYIKDISSKDKSLEEKDNSGELLSPPLKKRNKISLQKESIREVYSKEALAPSYKAIKEPVITEDVKLIINYWIECKLHMPKKQTKSYVNSINSIKNLLSGKTFSKKYTIEEIKQSINNFSNSVYNPEYEPLSIDKKKKLRSLSIGSFIRSYQGYSYFEDYLKKTPKTLIEDKFPEITNSLKKIYSEEVFGTTNKTYEIDQENMFRKASKKLKQFISENIVRWNNYMVPKTDYDEARLLWESIKYDFMGSDNFSQVTPNWLISNKTFEHRLPAFLFHQGYLTEDQSIKKSKISTFKDRDKAIANDMQAERDYWNALLYD